MKRLKSYYTKDKIEAGCDEAGRGCLAGPVVAAAVILPHNCRLSGLNDSKILTPEKRNALRSKIESRAIAWAVEFVGPKEIDQINILQASVEAMKRAVDRLKLTPELLLIDGKYFVPHASIPHQCIIKGDGKYRSIAAASILAKTHRDAYMVAQHKLFPFYCWDQNKGYPTMVHRKAILEKGPSPIHRKSFKLYPLPEQLQLF